MVKIIGSKKPKVKAQHKNPYVLQNGEPAHKFTRWDQVQGGSRKTLAKRRAAIIREARKRLCVNCKHFPVCDIGKSAVREAPKSLLHEIKCKMPEYMLTYYEKLANEDHLGIVLDLLTRVRLKSKARNEELEVADRFLKLVPQKNVNLNLNKIEKEIKLELVIVENKKEEVIIDEIKDDKVNADTSKQ